MPVSHESIQFAFITHVLHIQVCIHSHIIGLAYAHASQQMHCHFNKAHVGATMSGMVMIQSGSESELHAAVAYVGPVAVAVDARSNGFRVRM